MVSPTNLASALITRTVTGVGSAKAGALIAINAIRGTIEDRYMVLPRIV